MKIAYCDPTTEKKIYKYLKPGQSSNIKQQAPINGNITHAPIAIESTTTTQPSVFSDPEPVPDCSVPTGILCINS